MSDDADDELKQAYLRHKREALEKGMAFDPDEPRVGPGEDIRFASFSYWQSVKPGQWMDFLADVQNSGGKSVRNLGITAFVGPGPHYANAVDGIAARDQNWSVFYTNAFTVPPKQSTRSVMGYRVPEKLASGFYILNLILWENIHPFQPAKLWDRYFWRFEITA